MSVSGLVEGNRARNLSQRVVTCLDEGKFARCLSGRLHIAGSHWVPVEKGSTEGGLGHRAKDLRALQREDCFNMATK